MQHSAQIDTKRNDHKSNAFRGSYTITTVETFRISCLCGHQTDWFTSLSAAINNHADHIWTEALEHCAEEAQEALDAGMVWP